MEAETPRENTPPPVVVPWPDAGRAVLDMLAARSPAPAIAIVGVTGPVGAGKSTLARRLSGVVVSTDDYLPDYDLVAERERDDPAAADLDALARHLAALRAGRPVMAPVWSFHTHRRESRREVRPAPVIVCEGLHALHERIADLLDVRVFLDAPAPVRLARLQEREQTGERGWGVERATRFFHEVAEPTYARFAPDYRARAHLIVLAHEGQ